MLSRGAMDKDNRKRLLKRAEKHLKDLFLLRRDARPRTFDQILKETYNMDVYHTVKDWVHKTGLRGVDRIQVTADEKFVYNPPLPCRDVNSLWVLLQDYGSRHIGILRRDVLDSIPGVGVAEAAIKSLMRNINIMESTDESQQVLMIKSNLYSTLPKMNQNCIDLWSSVDISQVDDLHINDYLLKHGMNVQPKKFTVPKLGPRIRTRAGDRKQKKLDSDTTPGVGSVRHIKMNSHVLEDLKDYSEFNEVKQKKARRRKQKTEPSDSNTNS